jgi:putative redox protein
MSTPTSLRPSSHAAPHTGPNTTTLDVAFPGHSGGTLAGRLDLPAGPIRAYALLAHCFTCSKDLRAARSIAGELALAGIAVLRFDFTGLGASDGAFGDTDFSSNVDDLVLAADFLRTHHAAPTVLVGHSLGGAAVLAAAHRIPEARAVVTIGAPADVGHVLHHLGTSLDAIEATGSADVAIAGRTFRIARSFVEDARGQRLDTLIGDLKRALLVLHSPIDGTVGIENASRIFAAAKHPKSFVTLDDADHLLTRPRDAAYAARVVAAWDDRYLPAAEPTAVDDRSPTPVLVAETGAGRFQTAVVAGRHRLFADEPVAVGGLDTGPSPYDYLSIALGACTAMTLRLYAEHKRLPLPRIRVEVRHGKVPIDHCEDCGAVAAGRAAGHAGGGSGGRIDRFERIVGIDGEITPELAAKLVEIADKCPVHRTLTGVAAVVTRIAPTTPAAAPAATPAATGTGASA